MTNSNKKPFGWAYRHKASLNWELHVGEEPVSLRYPDSYEVVPLFKGVVPATVPADFKDERLDTLVSSLEPYVSDSVGPEADIKAEARKATIEALLEHASNRGRFFYPITMPLTKDGNGPAQLHEAEKITYEVWDQFCTSHGSFEHLSSAIDLSNVLNTAFEKLQAAK